MSERDDLTAWRLGRLLDDEARRQPLPADFAANLAIALPERTPRSRFAPITVAAVAATVVLAVGVTAAMLTIWRPTIPPPGSTGSPTAIVSGSPSPTATPTPGAPAAPTRRAEATVGDWQLVLSVDDAELPAGDPIVVRATLAYVGNQANVVAWGPQFGLIGFDLAQTNGTARLGSGGDTDCARHDFHQGSPLGFPFIKPTESSGGLPPWAGASYRDDPEFRLPEGTWDLSATARFSPGGSQCANPPVTITATLHLVTTSATTPSATLEKAPPVIRIDRFGELGATIPDIVMTVTADGRVTWTDATGDLVERDLTDAGLAMVQRALDDTHLLDADATFVPTPLPGVEPPARGGFGWTFHTVSTAGDPVTVSMAGISSDESQYWVTGQERLTLDALRAKLMDPVAWLPADAWADPAAHLYEPATWAVVLDIEPSQSRADSLADFTDFGWPIPDPAAFGASANDPNVQKAGTLRCGYLTSATMASILDRLAAYAFRTGSLQALQFWSSFAYGTDGEINVFLVKVLPDGSPDCAEVRG